MTQSRFRVGGAYTRITWNGSTLSYVDVIRETGPRPVAAPQAIQPIDAQYPIEIALPGALEAGTLEVTFREQWYNEVWSAFYATYNNNSTADLLDVFKAQLVAGDSTIVITKIILSPTETTPNGTPARIVTYHRPTIVNVMIDETVNIGTMTFPKSVQFMYTQRTETAFSDIGPGTGGISY